MRRGYAYVKWATGSGQTPNEYEACGFLEENTSTQLTLRMVYQLKPTQACIGENAAIDWGHVISAVNLTTGEVLEPGE